MKLEEVKEQQNIFKSYLNEISRGRFTSKEQKRALENIKLFYKSREAVIKLFNGYSSIVSEVKHKTKYEKGFKILTLKQVLNMLLYQTLAFAIHGKI